MFRSLLLAALLIAPFAFAQEEHHHVYGRSVVLPDGDVERERAVTSEAVVTQDEEYFRTDADAEVDQIDNDEEVAQIGEDNEVYAAEDDNAVVLGEDEDIDRIGGEMYEDDSLYDDAPDEIVTDDDIVRTTPEGDTMVWDDETGQYIIEKPDP